MKTQFGLIEGGPGRDTISAGGGDDHVTEPVACLDAEHVLKP